MTTSSENWDSSLSVFPKTDIYSILINPDNIIGDKPIAVECYICFMVAIEPVNLKCEHIICTSCCKKLIYEKKEESSCGMCRTDLGEDLINKMNQKNRKARKDVLNNCMMNIISSLKVKCDRHLPSISSTNENNNIERCQETFVIGTDFHGYFDHQRKCKFFQIQCPNSNCQEYVYHQDLKTHIDTCPFTIIKCKHCLIQITRGEINDHYAKGKEKGLICDGKMFCKYDCQPKKKRKWNQETNTIGTFNKHSIHMHYKLCTKRPIECKICFDVISHDQLKQHYLDNLESHLTHLITNYNDDDDIPLKQKQQQHLIMSSISFPIIIEMSKLQTSEDDEVDFKYFKTNSISVHYNVSLTNDDNLKIQIIFALTLENYQYNSFTKFNVKIIRPDYLEHKDKVDEIPEIDNLQSFDISKQMNMSIFQMGEGCSCEIIKRNNSTRFIRMVQLSFEDDFKTQSNYRKCLDQLVYFVTIDKE
jgi:hypothetical protein